MLAARQSERVLGVVSIAILARLLTPADFGLVGMAVAATALVDTLTAFGFDWALVRLPKPTRSHYDTAWTMRVIVGLVAGTVILAAALPVGRFYGRSEISLIMVTLALNSALGGLENIGTVDFRRQMRFDKEAQLRISAKLAGMLVSISVAALFRTYWALIWGILAGRLVSVGCSYLLSRFRPRLCLSERKELLSFSGWLLASNMLSVVSGKLADFYIGREFGPRQVGIYSMASELSSLATTELAGPINRVVFTRYSQNAGNTEFLRLGFIRVSGLIWAVGLPAAAGISASANEIVEVLLGRQWLEAIQVLQILALAGALSVMGANTHYIFWALGRSRFSTVLGAVAFLVFLPATVLLGRKHGVVGVAEAQVVASVVVLALNYAVLARTIELPLGMLVGRNWRVFIASLLMAGAVSQLHGYLVRNLHLSAMARLTMMVSLGLASYTVSLAVIWYLSGRPAGPESEVAGYIWGIGRGLSVAGMRRFLQGIRRNWQ